MHNDLSQKLIEQINNAVGKKSPLVITGGGSKAFYGNRIEGEVISTAEHTGIIEYQPSELVITVRSGTLLSELEAELKANKQMLAFEPPQHSAGSTIGGVIACGLSGPRRPACGAARDFVLGTTIINGKAEKCRFGGQVMKNVAGYDVSRLMVGAQGTLGVLLDISIKVLPIDETEITLRSQIDLNSAIKHIRQWIKQGLPITASCYHKNTLYIRLSSTHSAVKKAHNTISNLCNAEETDNNIWLEIKNQTHDFFTDNSAADKNLWRCSHQSNTEFYGDTENQLIEWNGALRWVHSNNELHTKAAQLGGHATRYPLDKNGKKSSDNSNDIFQPLQPGLLKIHQRLKQSFDPECILNPGRLYQEM